MILREYNHILLTLTLEWRCSIILSFATDPKFIDEDYSLSLTLKLEDEEEDNNP